MKPIKASELKARQNSKRLKRPVLDLREFNMVHAAPVENGRPIITLRYDPVEQALVPKHS